MAIKRHSCRISERKRMREMQSEGYKVQQISNAVSVHEHIVTDVLDGTWEAAEQAHKKQQKINDEARRLEAENKEQNQAAIVAGAVVTAIDNKAKEDELRAQIRAELEAEQEEELSPQKRAAITRKKNKESAEQDEAVA